LTFAAGEGFTDIFRGVLGFEYASAYEFRNRLMVWALFGRR